MWISVWSPNIDYNVDVLQGTKGHSGYRGPKGEKGGQVGRIYSTVLTFNLLLYDAS